MTLFRATKGAAMRVKNVSVSFKAGPDDGLEEGQFLVYPSTFTRQPDSYGDVVAKGAFEDSIKGWVESGDVMPAMYMHDPNQIVGGATEMGEDDHGWWVKGFFDDDPASRRIYNLVKGRRLTSLSFAFNVLDEGEVELEDGTKANELRKLSVHEFSFLPKGFAANDDTSVVTIKAAADALAQGVKAGRVLSSKNEEAISVAVEQISGAADHLKAILAAVRGGDEEENDQEKASGQGRVNDEEPESAKSEEPAINPSVEALALTEKLYALNVQEGVQE